MIHKIDRNEWLLHSAFQQVYGKISVGFVLTQQNVLVFLKFHFKGNKKSIGSSKN